MSEENTQGQATSETDNSTEDRKTSQRSSRNTDDSGEERSVPYNRFAEVNRAKREAEQRLSQLEAEQAQEQEERARKKGEYESLATKYKGQVEAEKQKRQAAEAALVNYKRLSTWREAAKGIILDEALDYSFNDLDEEDFGNMDETDLPGMTRLAEMLVDRRPFLAAGPRGAGSGFGSRQPVLQRPSQSRNTEQQSSTSGSGIRPIFKKPKRRQWK